MYLIDLFFKTISWKFGIIFHATLKNDDFSLYCYCWISSNLKYICTKVDLSAYILLLNMFSVLWMVDYHLYAETNFSLSHVVWKYKWRHSASNWKKFWISKFTKILGGYQARPVNLRFLIVLKNVLNHKIISGPIGNLKLDCPYSCF